MTGPLAKHLSTDTNINTIHLGEMGISTRRLKIIICGGGIAGFSTALLLREDHDVVILEASNSNQELGAAITLAMNASRLLCTSYRRAGLDPGLARYVEAEKVGALNGRRDLSGKG
jgi:salicylate hydroxylase